MSDLDILNDLQNMDLSGVETAMPILEPGMKDVRVTEVKVEPNAKKNGNNIHIRLALVNPDVSRDGKPVNAGFPLFDLISLVQTEKYDPRQRLAAFMEGVLGTKEGSFMPLEQYIGQTATVNVTIEESDEYGPKNRIKRYLKKG